MIKVLTLTIEKDTVAVCRLAPDAAIPAWATRDGFCSVTRTAEELSIVCKDDSRIPHDVKCERGWKLLRVAGTQAFSQTGILSSVLDPLADAGIGIFAISTFDTDYVMVKSEDFEQALAALRRAGHAVR